MAFKQDINLPVVVTTAIVSAIVLVVLILGAQAWYEFSETAETETKVADAPRTEYAELKDQQAQSIQRVGWTDASKAAVTIPIEQAMNIVVSSHGEVPSTQPGTILK